MKKHLRLIISLVLFALIAYNAVYFRKLSEVKAGKEEPFDAAAYAKNMWQNQLGTRMDSAVELSVLMDALAKDPAAAFNRYTHALAVGNYGYVLVKFKAQITQVNEDDLIVQLPMKADLVTLKIATEFIYGNAIRDASGLIDLNAFPNTANLNNVSEELNKIARSLVINPVKPLMKKGDLLEVTGAMELNKAHLNQTAPEIIPVRLKIVQ